MDTLYTCHNCNTQFELLADDVNSDTSVGLNRRAQVTKVKVKCPGCYGSGYTSTERHTYTIDITNIPVLV